MLNSKWHQFDINFVLAVTFEWMHSLKPWTRCKLRSIYPHWSSMSTFSRLRYKNIALLQTISATVIATLHSATVLLTCPAFLFQVFELIYQKVKKSILQLAVMQEHEEPEDKLDMSAWPWPRRSGDNSTKDIKKKKKCNACIHCSLLHKQYPQWLPDTNSRLPTILEEKKKPPGGSFPYVGPLVPAQAESKDFTLYIHCVQLHQWLRHNSLHLWHSYKWHSLFQLRQTSQVHYFLRAH